MAEIRVNATGGLKLFDADDSHYAQIIAGTITSNVDVLTLGHASADFNIPVKVLGTTPTLTIGDAGAEDTKIVFDGNAQDYYIALDDSADDLVIGKGSTVGTTPAISIDSDLKVNIPVTTAATSASTGSLITGGGMGVGADLYVGDDTYLITDSAVLGFGADKDTTLTHTDGTGLTLNSTNKICFNDATQFVQGSSGTVLSIGATDEIDLTATAVDLNGTLDVSGTSLLTGRVGVVTAGDLGNGIHIRISDAGAVSGGLNTDADDFVIENSASAGMTILSGTSNTGAINFADSGDANAGLVRYDHANNSLDFFTSGSERMNINSTGLTCISNNGSFATSYLLDVNGTGTIMRMNRADDGAMLLFQSAGTTEGYVAISGTTCTYYTFTGGHWGQLSDLSNPTVLKGTVIETIDEMCEWYVVEITRKKGDTEEDEIIKVPHILQVGQSVGDTITVTYEGTEYSGDIVKETNNNLAKVKISDSEDSKAVYGVFQNWDEDNDMSVVALGTFVVRVHKDETVAIGDLLSSKGDGTAKVQADDIMRSRTIAKVTSTIKQTTYADDSYTVPCTLHCG